MIALGKVDAAIEQFEQALQIDPGYRPAQDNLSRFHEGAVGNTPAENRPK